MIQKNVKVVSDPIETGDISPEQLNKAPNGFFESISTEDMLETNPDDIFPLLCSKLRVGGKLSLAGRDGHDMCRQIAYGTLDVNQVDISKDHRLNTIPHLQRRLLDNNFRILFVGTASGRYLIEAKKH